VQLSLAARQAGAALLTELIQAGRVHTWTTTSYQWGTCTAACAQPRSIGKRE
jgi:hypothetical protein